MDSEKYSKIEKLYENNNTIVYKALNLETKKVVAYKTIKNTNYASDVYVEMLKKEYYLLSLFDCGHVVKAIEFVENREVALITEYVKGQLLSEIIERNKLTFDEKIVLTLEILKSLSKIHKMNIIHKDINPSNLIWDFVNEKIVVIDFNISEKLLSQKVEFVGQKHAQGTLPYMSPEQTGRMNREVDYRSDYYSLGVTLYELFLARKPYDFDNYLELVHSHIAIYPIDPVTIDKNFNIIMSKVIMKLLSKNAGDRYHSIDGIISDIEMCKDTSIDPLRFIAGEKDELDKLDLSQKIYGRERIVEDILSGFINVMDGGFECRFITGYSGVGKTSVVNELYKPITNVSAYFMSGKYDKYSLGTPYSAFIEAIDGFIDLILLEGEENLANWKSKFEEELGENCKVLTEFIPKLELVLGKQEDIIKMPGLESQNRFNNALEKFLFILADRKHPLVLFLDDIQWIDSASVNLIERIIENQNLDFFYLLCAYRSNEVKTSHILKTFINKVEDLNIKYYEINELKAIDIKHFLRDSFVGLQNLDYIVDKTIEKTNGNAFFMKKMIKHFYDEGCIYYLHSEKRWKIDETCFEKLQVFDNVGNFLANKLSCLSEEELHVLKCSAHMGKTINIKVLSDVLLEEDISLEDVLSKLLEGGYFISLGFGIYMFAHDQIKQTAYIISSEDEKNQIKLKIVDKLIRIEKTNYSDEIIFKIAGQLKDLSLDAILDLETSKIIKYLLDAGDLSTRNIAFSMAKEYYLSAKNFTSDDMWKTNYSIMLRLFNSLIENAYLLGEFDKIDYYVDFLKTKVEDSLELALAYESKIQSLMARQMYQEGIATMLDALKDFDMELSLNVGELEHQKAFEDLEILMGGRSVASLMELPIMEDTRYIAIMRMLTAVLPLLFNAAPQLLPIVVIDMVKLSIYYGNSIYSCFAYTFFGTILCAIVGDIEKGDEYGEIALELVEKLDAKSELAKTYVITALHVLHYKKHLNEVIKVVEESFYKGVETGDLTYAGFAGHGYCFMNYLAGKELYKTQKKFESYSETLDKINQGTQNQFQKLYLQAIVNLREKPYKQWIFDGGYFDENTMLATIVKSGHKTALFVFYFLKMQIAYIFNQYDYAWEASESMFENLDAGFGLMHTLIFYQYRSLILLAKYVEMDSKDKHNTLKVVYENQKYLENLSNEINYRHRYLIVEAEIARATLNYKLARELYEEALEIVKRNNYVSEEALYREIIFRYYEEVGNKELSSYYKSTSMLAYKKWGARMKSNSSIDKNTNLDTMRFDRSTYTLNTLDTEFVSSNNINLKSILKVSQVMSSEIVYDELLAKMISILIENSGATKATIINYSKDGALVIASSSTSDDFTLGIYDSIDEYNDIPKSLINYIYNTKKVIRINEADEDELFCSDQYIKNNQLKSVMCFPLINKSELLGIIYLENKLTKGVFLKEHMQFISLLSTQITVSLENATLYRHLEMLVENRTRELEIKNEELLEVNRKLEFISITDNLTGLLNRRKLDEILEYEYAKSVRYSSTFAIILLDLDTFKRVNDNFGHGVGDEVLIKVAEILKSNTREIDLVGRWGGEEFLVICPEIDSKEASKLAEKLRIKLEYTEFEYVGRQTASFGVSSINLYESIKDIMKRADDNLYIAKSDGRNKVVNLNNRI